MSDEAIPAATLVVVRDRPGGPPDLLMVERPEGMAFAGGALVFPGGRVDPADREFARRLGLREDGAERVTAIRETIEETAIPAGLLPLPSPETALDLQRRLADGEAFAELLERAGLQLDPVALTPLARWVPKFHAVRRFDTVFFVAAAPAGNWSPAALEGECTGAFWITAGEVLAKERAGEARLIFPTRRNLERLAQHDRFAAVKADAEAHPIDPITPWVEERGGEKFITIPREAGYPVTEEKLEGLWRG